MIRMDEESREGSSENLSFRGHEKMIPRPQKRSKCATGVLAQNRYDFNPLITPVIDIVVLNGKHQTRPTFSICRNEDLVTLTWEPFKGTISESGTKSVLVRQSLGWLPEYPIEFPINIYYKGKRETASIVVTPHGSYHLEIFLPEGVMSRIHDSIKIPGSAISWVVRD
jgi:hypothetical protein